MTIIKKTLIILSPRKKLWIILLGAILTLLVLTNPTYEDFEKFTNDYEVSYYSDHETLMFHESIRRKLGYNIIYSVYSIETFNRNNEIEKEGNEYRHFYHKYIGFFNNFFEIQ